MAAPDPGMVRFRRNRRGVQASFTILVLVLALLTTLGHDGAWAFRIRDGSSASSELTRPTTCNPLLGRCTETRNPVGTSASSSSPTLGIRKRFESSNTSPPSTAKIQQPLVEESVEAVEFDEGKSVGRSSYGKSKSVRLQLRTPFVSKANIGRGGGKSNPPLSSDEDDKGEETEENDDDDQEGGDDTDDGNVDEENMDDTEEENDDENIGKSDAEDDDDDDDEKSNSVDNEDSEIDSNELDEGEDEDESLESEASQNDDEEADVEERNTIENDDDTDSDQRDPKIGKYTSGNVRVTNEQEISNDKTNVRVGSTRDPRSVEKKMIKRTVDDIAGVDEVQAVPKERKVDVNVASNSDQMTSRPVNLIHVKTSDEKVAAPKSKIINEIVQPPAKSKMDADKNVNDTESDDDDSDKDDESDIVVEIALPSRKLEKVRLADKSKSMEATRAKSLEETAKKTVSPNVEKASSERKTIEPSKPAKPSVQESEVKFDKKSTETIASTVPTVNSRETKKSKVQESGKTIPQQKKENKPQPKQSEKMAAKAPGPKIDQKPEKLKPKLEKRTGAVVTLSELNDLLLHVPSFTPNFTAIEDPVCQQHGKIFLRQLRGYKLWALQMLDASAKLPSGLLRGNLNQLGDFDQCIGVKAHVKIDEKTVKVQGKYCLATIDLQATRQEMKIPVNMMQSRAFLRASMNEPAHFIPRFTTVNWALCVPAACSAEDVRSVMESALSSYNVSLGLKFNVGLDSESCYVKEKPQPYSKETVAVLYFYAMTVCLVFVATVRDFIVTSDGPGSYSERIIMAFSLRRTTTALLVDSQDGKDIRCIHGIRTLATIFLYIAHKLIPIARIPFANRISLTEVANSPISSVLRVSLIYTDSFLLLSGVLTAYHMASEFNKRGEIRWFCRFVTRFIRLTPALLAVVYWYAFVMEHTGFGPQWSPVVKSNADLCKKNAWTNLLYIQNFFPFEEMCATHTHQLALDMQLSLIAPMLVFFLYNKPIVGLLVILFLLQVSATVRYLATTSNYLSLVIFHGMTLKHLYKTANLTYALPLHRATPYLFGVALGVLLRNTGKQVRIHKAFVFAGWLTAASLGSWSLFSTWRLARRDYSYDVEEATFYAVILPVCWAASLCWIIFASYTEHGGAVNRFLSSYWLVVLSRLSYSVYLTQFAVFFYNVGTTRYASEFQVHRAIDLYEVASVICVSIVLTLLLDLPMQEVKNVIMECTNDPVIEKISSVGHDAEVTRVADEQVPEEPLEIREPFEFRNVDPVNWGQQRRITPGEGDEYAEDNEPPEGWTYRDNENVRTQSFVRRIVDEEEEPTWGWTKGPVRRIPRHNIENDRVLGAERRSQSRQEYSDNDYSDEPKFVKKQQGRDEEEYRRDQRSQSRAFESRRSLSRDLDEISLSVKKRNGSIPRTGEMNRSSAKDFAATPREFARAERSLTRETDNNAIASKWRSDEQPSWEYTKRERSASQSARDGERLAVKGLEAQRSALRLSTGSLPHASGEFQVKTSSGSERESNREEKPKLAKTMPLEEPRVSDEEGWEEELKLRRETISKTLPSEETTGTASEEEEWNVLKRRSSAEGKMALLNDSAKIEHFGAWSMRKVPQGSDSVSHEFSESDEENSYHGSRNDYRETRPPFRESYETQSDDEASSWNPSRQQSYTSSQPTSVDEEGDSSAYDFVLKKVSKRSSLQNLSRISQEEPEPEEDSGWDFVKEENTDTGNLKTTATGLFKRASIVKSQASEEDPEYLLPERPKLVEQEQEHPFKKAWQMQKSRSEEDGPTGFLVKDKDANPKTSGAENRKDNSKQEELAKRRPTSGGQKEDLSYFAGDEAESTSVSYPASNSGDSANLDWAEEEERSEGSRFDDTELESTESLDKEMPLSEEREEQNRYSEELNWKWNQEET
ncbi:uncharacterized protein LOC105688083 [Athalia rosae]|uniref:uncharacterized protein LOC105688083 n=1 Tax=Athalia rosae TaxID=37344 RepID=UPI0020333CBE|nr:uncharacterized protein LOC105688083 [Athalia rosae]